MRQQPWSDMEMLRLLDMRDNDGHTFSEIAEYMGRSKNSLIGLYNRIRKECPVPFPEEPRDATMPRHWWRR